MRRGRLTDAGTVAMLSLAVSALVWFSRGAISLSKGVQRTHREPASAFDPDWNACLLGAQRSFRRSDERFRSIDERIQATYPRPDPYAETLRISYEGDPGVNIYVALSTSRVHGTSYEQLVRLHREKSSVALICSPGAFLVYFGAPFILDDHLNGFNLNIGRIGNSNQFVWAVRPMASSAVRMLQNHSDFSKSLMTWYATSSLEDVLGNSIAWQSEILNATLEGQSLLSKSTLKRPRWTPLGQTDGTQALASIEDSRSQTSLDGQVLCFIGTWMQPKHPSAACSSLAEQKWIFPPILYPNLRHWSADEVPINTLRVANFTLRNGQTRFYSTFNLWKSKNLMPLRVNVFPSLDQVDLVVLDVSEQALYAISMTQDNLPRVSKMMNLENCAWLPRNLRGSSGLKHVDNTDIWIGLAHSRARFAMPHQSYYQVVVVLRGAGKYPTRCSGVLNDVFLPSPALINSTLSTRGIMYANGMEILQSDLVRHSNGTLFARVRVVITGGMEDLVAVATLAELWIVV